MVVPSAQNKIMVVDDDPAVRYLISRFFSYNNYEIAAAEDAKTARKIFQIFQPDLVILDVNLPDDSGFNLCQEIRQTGKFVLMLTCLTDANYVLKGFERGADDYQTKPFNLEILKAKIEALLKRRQVPNDVISPLVSSYSPRLIFDNLIIDPQKFEVVVGEKIVSLTALEFELLYFLASHPDRVWERSELILSVWSQNDEIGAERKVDVHIGQIRKKIGDFDSKWIKTIRGKGYMFEPPVWK
ncbi:MAG: response regulator transcription factor [Hydrococcus sp. C42_A2020_068]|uniref:response regulator transcription factor n=1 Tax=Pleurocapsa sp. PCC 7327 TaxID=118163 RepID=UPI00029FB12E|nr:response regulator transcription factor [Pleurocapsa sp. PCC 7327]AFY77529.1 response regulator with CheY-like receiver domain and winged-helix DNA-binding domain [Pleurocapsa sp. PCC 7327]MBF2022285.1 response regulator transcription factor [Hydrococcus sp. C42_A2020_068]